MMEIKRRITRTYFNYARLQYAPLINKLSLLIGINRTHSEELRVRADEELLKCMICYNGSGSLTTFLYHRLIGIFKHMRDAENRAKRIQSVPIDFISNIAGPNCDMDSSMMAKECLGYLNDKEYYIITELFLNDKTMREIYDDSEIVTSTICRIKARAISKMQQKYGVK